MTIPVSRETPADAINVGAAMREAGDTILRHLLKAAYKQAREKFPQIRTYRAKQIDQLVRIRRHERFASDGRAPHTVTIMLPDAKLFGWCGYARNAAEARYQAWMKLIERADHG